MTSGTEQEEERGRKGTVSSQGGGGKEQRLTASKKVAKIVKIVGTLDKSWQEAATVAVEEARKTIRGIRGIKVKDMTARIDPMSGRIVEYPTLLIYPLEYLVTMKTAK